MTSAQSPSPHSGICHMPPLPSWPTATASPHPTTTTRWRWESHRCGSSPCWARGSRISPLTGDTSPRPRERCVWKVAQRRPGGAYPGDTW